MFARGSSSIAFILLGLVSAVVATPPQDSSPAGPTAQPGRISYRFEFAGNVAQVPMDLLGNRIFVPVRVNDTQPSLFLLDTESSNTGIDEGRARELGLVATLAGAPDSSSTSEPQRSISGPMLRLPGVEIRLPSCGILPLAEISSLLGRSVQGSLGIDVLEQFVVELDYSRLTIHLYDPNSFEYSGKGVSLPLTMAGSLPLVGAKIRVPGRKPVEALFALTSGFDGAVAILKPFKDARKLLSSHQKTHPSEVVDAGSTAKSLQVRIQELQIGPYIFTEPVADFLEEGTGAPSHPEIAGNVGTEVLRRFKVILDFAHSRVILERNTHFREPFEVDMSGATLAAEGPSFQLIRVKQVLPHSPAAAAGLQAGDILAGIDGHPAVEYKLADIRDLFKLPDLQYKLTIDRGGKSLDLKIKLRRLI